MPFPYEIYKFLPVEKEWLFRNVYFPLPQNITKEIIKKAEEEKFVFTENGIVYPSPELKQKFQPIELKENINFENIKTCLKFMEKNFNPEFYQAIVQKERVFNNPYFKQFDLNFPYLKNFKYLFVGEGHCFVEYFLEKGLSKEQIDIIDIDSKIVNYFKSRGLNAYQSDARLLSFSLLPKAPYDVIISYHIEYYQTFELVKLAQTNISKYGYFYLFLTLSEDKMTFRDFYLILKTLYKFGFWINYINPFIIQSIYIGFNNYWNFWKNFLEEF
jgi:hypothetical protein